MSPTPAWLNGEFLPLEEARVPVLDRGFLFADGVYEVIPAYRGRPFRMDRHLRRLDRSLAAIGMAPPLDDAAWARVFAGLMARDPEADWSLYLQVTRGMARARNHVPPKDPSPTVLAWAAPLAPLPGDGIAAITLEDIRWQRCDIKAIALLANVLSRAEADRRGAYEAILVRDGRAWEGAASNLFVVLDGEVRTPPLSERILGGIIREVVIELAEGLAIPCHEVEIPLTDLGRAEEVWLTSSTREILPVVHLDGRPVGEGTPGPLWARAMAAYQDLKRREGAA